MCRVVGLEAIVTFEMFMAIVGEYFEQKLRGEFMDHSGSPRPLRVVGMPGTVAFLVFKCEVMTYRPSGLPQIHFITMWSHETPFLADTHLVAYSTCYDWCDPLYGSMHAGVGSSISAQGLGGVLQGLAEQEENLRELLGNLLR